MCRRIASPRDTIVLSVYSIASARNSRQRLSFLLGLVEKERNDSPLCRAHIVRDMTEKEEDRWIE